MTDSQKQKLISLGDKTIKEYVRIQNKIIEAQGYTINNIDNMTYSAKKAFKNLLKEPIDCSWDEVCEVFDSIKK